MYWAVLWRQGTAPEPHYFDDYLQEELTELAQLGEDGGGREIYGIKWMFGKLNRMPKFRRGRNINKIIDGIVLSSDCLLFKRSGTRCQNSYCF